MDQLFSITGLLAIIFLFASAILTMFSTSMMSLGKYLAKKHFKIKKSILFRFLPKSDYENLHFTINSTKNILILLYATCTFIALLKSFSEGEVFNIPNKFSLFLITVIIIVISILVDYVIRFFAILWSGLCLSFSTPFASLFLLIFLPITYPLLKLTKYVFQVSNNKKQIDDSFLIKERIDEMLKDTHLNPYDQKLISSFITFRQRVAREIMIPRIDLCTLSTETTIKEATKIFIEEGFSRIPIYKENLDHIVGVALYKDILQIYSENASDEKMNTRIDTIIKPVIYAPENKKISLLLQEFRSKQNHLAIVVNEYGGTEGIVTIEDILEELVGEIEDEYDNEEDVQFWKLPDGAFVVNAKMSIIDIEENLGIHIPKNSEYETVGGFIFHKAGTIPSKGWNIHHEEFSIEVLSSDERSIKKIRITPIVKKPQDHS